MGNFDDFLATNHTDLLVVKEKILTENHVSGLMKEYKEIIIRSLIDQFGIGSFIDVYKEGGNVTTLHNAQNDVFATKDDQDRFTYQYNRKEKRTKDMYDNKLPGIRKSTFQNEGNPVDAYTGKLLPKDGRAHIDHVVAASKIQKNDEARLYMSDKHRGEMATGPDNLAWTDARLNQSKSDKDLAEWMDSSNKNKEGEKNAERFDVDREAAEKINTKAKNSIEKEINSKKKDYYTEKVIDTSRTQGHQLGKRQAIGYFLYELQNAFFSEMKIYFKKFKSFVTIKNKILKFTAACQRVTVKVVSKIKGIANKYMEGFAGGVLGNIVTIFINTFATTAKNLTRVLNEGIQALVKAFVLLVKRPKDMTKGEAIKQASLLVSAAVSTAIGVALTETFIAYLRTTPLAPFAELVGGILGVILTGIMTATVLYAIDNMGSILKSIANILDDIAHNFKVSSKEIRARYEAVLDKIDEDYEEIVKKICLEYEKFYSLTKNAYNSSIGAKGQFHHTIVLASEMNVEAKQVLKNKQDILDFFN